VVAVDFGIKRNILRCLVDAGCKVTVVPARTSAADILAMKPSGVFLSNGPGDPAAVTYAIETIKQLIGKTPLFGICLGHQLLGLALGCKTYKLKFGHRGLNQPVKDLSTGRIEITTQNHGFAVDVDSMGGQGHHDARAPQRRHLPGLRTHRDGLLRGAVPPRGGRWPARLALPLRALHRADERRERMSTPGEARSRPRRPLGGARLRQRLALLLVTLALLSGCRAYVPTPDARNLLVQGVAAGSLTVENRTPTWSATRTSRRTLPPGARTACRPPR
jgi:hypothetical protein